VSDVAGRYRAANASSSFFIYEGFSLNGRVAQCAYHQVNNREHLDPATIAAMGSAEVRFSKNSVEIALEGWSHRQQGLVRWLAWEKARKDWLAKGLGGGLGASRGAKEGLLIE
jgi:hypothetical protein